MIHTLHKDITCEDAITCSHQLQKKVEKLNLKLSKIKATDPLPDGSITILHTPNNHTITIEIYTKNITTKQIEDTL